MNPKPAILNAFTREDLKQVVDDLGIDGVDRRSVDGMRAALRKARRAKPETLLPYLRKEQIKEVCEVMGVSLKGKRDELVERLVNGEERPKLKQAANKVARKGAPVASNHAATTQVNQSEINGILWKACDTFRGAVDPSEYKNLRRQTPSRWPRVVPGRSPP